MGKDRANDRPLLNVYKKVQSSKTEEIQLPGITGKSHKPRTISIKQQKDELYYT